MAMFPLPLGSALEEPTIQVMKLLCYEFQDMPPLILELLKANIDFLVDRLCDRMDEVSAVSICSSALRFSLVRLRFCDLTWLPLMATATPGPPDAFILVPIQKVFACAGEAVVSGQPQPQRACKYVLNFMANIFNLAPLAVVSPFLTWSPWQW